MVSAKAQRANVLMPIHSTFEADGHLLQGLDGAGALAAVGAADVGGGEDGDEGDVS
jgi:hypothetical protein